MTTLLLRDASVPFVQRRYGADPPALDAMLTTFDESLRRLIGHFAAVYADMMLGSIRKAQARTALMLEAAETAGSTLDPGRVLQRVAQGIAAALRVGFCCVYEANADGSRLEPRIQVGELADERLRGQLNRVLRPSQDPLIRNVLSTHEPTPYICRDKDPFLGDGS